MHRHAGCDKPSQWPRLEAGPPAPASKVAFSAFRLIRRTMGIDFHLIANFGALALITLAGPAVIFILFYRRGAL
jgi:hypothetical protein